MVAHLPNLVNHDLERTRKELTEVVRAVRATEKTPSLKSLWNRAICFH